MYVAKTKTLISCAVTAQLICVFVFAYAQIRFSHDAAHFKENKGMVALILVLCPSNNPPTAQAVYAAFEFHRWGSFSTASRRRFHSKRKCPLSRE